VGSTGAWTTYQDFTGSAPIAFAQGSHVVTIAFEGVSRINLDRLAFSAAAPAPTTTSTPPPIVLPTATPTSTPEVQNATLSAFAGASAAPNDLDHDGCYEDLNGNGRKDFADVTLLFNNLGTVASSYPVDAFDFNGNDRIDYADVITLYNRL
jgi:PKD repeat protein